MRWTLAFLFAACVACSQDAAGKGAGTSDLKSDEVVEFAPTFAVRSGETWQVPIEAWVYEPEQDDRIRNAALAGVGEVVELAEGDPAAEAFVIHNLRPFLVDNERGKTVVLRAGKTTLALPESGPDGRARGTLVLPLDAAAAGSSAIGSPRWITLEAVLRPGDDRRFEAHAQLLADEGLSVISDVDDTVKVSEVHDKRKLIENTFAKGPRAAAGMPAAYARWAKTGAAFHYVSNSPLPLLGAMMRFLDGAGLPRGSIALRAFRWKDGSVLELLGNSDFKRETIRGILSSFERRRFVLVGDTGEHDPEIYAAIARAFPERVSAIYLRDPLPGGTPGLDARLAAAFAGLPANLWRVFADGSELPAKLR